jgi:uncharacterized membrane protein
MTTEKGRTKISSQGMTKDNATMQIILTGLMMAMIVVATILIVIPTPFTNGYIHLGDAMIFLSVLILGWKRGAVAAGVGSALADLLVGYAVWAPWTLVIKGAMGAVMGLFILKAMRKPGKSILGVPVYQLFGMIWQGFLCSRLFYRGGLIYGNFISSAMGIRGISCSSRRLMIASILAAALYKRPPDAVHLSAVTPLAEKNHIR